MYKQTYHIEELVCHDCAMEIVEKIESYDFIKNVYIDYDANNITIESERVVKKEEVEKVVKQIVAQDHESKHVALFNSLQNIVTDEYLFEDIDCPSCALKVEDALKKDERIYDAKVNYLSKKVIIKHLNNIEIYNIASKIVAVSEPGAKLIKEGEEHKEECECSEHHHHDHDECEC
ncbi:MAG: heavy-metal-associated domain-containing protein, partial [Bacilli bacterium]|nr:heavy-metal-associated domain-containing protein [Bacilli bacterium]